VSLFQKEPSELAIGVIGAGRVGRALAIALERAGYRVKGIARRTPGGPYASADALVASCDLIFLAVPDSALEGLAIELPWRVGQGVVHTSGASGLDVLRGVTARGAHAGGLHPLQAFPDGDPAPERFAGTTCGIEGPPALAVVLDRIATRTGARPLRLDGANRALYHASAVFASNFAIALLVAARRASRSCRSSPAPSTTRASSRSSARSRVRSRGATPTPFRVTCARSAQTPRCESCIARSASSCSIWSSATHPRHAPRCACCSTRAARSPSRASPCGRPRTSRAAGRASRTRAGTDRDRPAAVRSRRAFRARASRAW